MVSKLFGCLTIAVLIFAAPALSAKSKPPTGGGLRDVFPLIPAALAKIKSKSETVGKGVTCSQAGNSVTFGISEFKVQQRNGLRKGMQARIKLAGYGPIVCVVY